MMRIAHMMRLALHAAHAAALVPGARRFAKALRKVEAVQAAKLSSLLVANADTAFGRAHAFGGIGSPRAYQDRVPISDYAGLSPWIESALEGRTGILTREPILCFERSSGSTAGEKWIPYTATLLREFAAATQPWMAQIYFRFPGCLGKRSYWSISPATRGRETTPGGIPIGFDDDTGYFGPLERWALRRMQAVGSEVARIRDAETWRRATLEALMQADDLGFLSVWHPSFLTVLLEALAADWESWLARLPAGRAAQLRMRRSRLADGGYSPEASLGAALWPGLALVSCWAHGPARSACDALRRWLPQARFQPKGLLATEGVVTLPYERSGETEHVAAMAGHFLEFEDLLSPGKPPWFAHEIPVGAEAAPILTTGGGLYRYRLGDAVRCTGRLGEAPLLEFLGRCDQTVDLCGEKLNALQVAGDLDAVQEALGHRFDFTLVAPVADRAPGYSLFVEGLPEALRDRAGELLEARFCLGSGYRYARQLGQLQPVAVYVVNTGNAVNAAEGGRALYFRAKAAQGMRLGQIKPVALEKPGPWITLLDAVPARVSADAA